MAKKKLNIALIGTQFMGKTHSNAFRKLSMFFDLPCEPVMKVVCDIDPDAAQNAVEKYGWQESTDDYKELVKRDDIDVVDIVTPNFLHSEMAIAAANAGKHVICEKPMANTLQECQAMLDAAEKAGVKHMCGFTYRFAPAVCTVKKMIQDGDLGEIYHFRACYQQDWIMDPNFPINWRLQRKTAGSGALGDIGAHIVDMCQNLLGPIDEVVASTRTFIKERPITEGQATIAAKKTVESAQKGTVDVDDAAVFLAHFSGQDTLATFEATRFAGGRRNYNGFEIYGSKGSVFWNVEDMNILNFYGCSDQGTLQGFRRIQATDPGHPYTEAWWPSGHIIGYEHLFVHEMYEFLSQLDSKDATYPTFADGVKCQKVLDAVERSVKSRTWEKAK